jgi:RNA polymerase sigma-70 factor (ECF subfamily)
MTAATRERESRLVDDVRDMIRRCLAGDERAMVDLVERYRGQVFGLCYRMLQDRQDAEDITQEAFLRVFRNLETWDQQREFKPWLLAIAGNRCRTLLASRKRKPSPTHLLDEVVDGTTAPEPSGLVEEVELALTNLRDEYRQAFLLFHKDELSYAEISEILDCPVGTIKTWIHRARRELAKCLRRRGIVQEPHYES